MEPQGNADRGPAESRGGSKPLLSVVVPVYCEESGIGEFYARTKAMLVACKRTTTTRSSSSTMAAATIRWRSSPTWPGATRASASSVSPAISAISSPSRRASTAPPATPWLSSIPTCRIRRRSSPACWPSGRRATRSCTAAHQAQGESRFKLVTASLYYRFMQTLSDTKIALDAGDFRLVDRAVADVIRRMREEHR